MSERSSAARTPDSRSRHGHHVHDLPRAESAQQLGKRREAENEHRQPSPVLRFASPAASPPHPAPVFYPRTLALRSAHPPRLLPAAFVSERVYREHTHPGEIYTGARVHRPRCDPGAALPLD